MNISVLDRFLRYAGVDTQSSPDSGTVPSTPGQTVLSQMLAEELREMGALAELDEASGIVYASIPSNIRKKVPAIGWVAHVDTAPGVPGSGVNPSIVHSYDGGDIVLDGERGVVLSPDVFPELKEYVGQNLVVTDGKTLLGADDKAGIAEIMDMAASFLLHPERPHGDIRIAFTPDEEIGRGADNFDVARFGADFAYTVDGGRLGEIEYENFNAASAVVTAHGKSIHPGSAKGRMVNASLLLMEFQFMLPTFQNPACTEGYEGFYHLDSFRGDVEQAVAEYLIRDHDSAEFECKKEFMRDCAALLNRKYGEGSVIVEIEDSYYNMRGKILPHMHLVDHARQAMEAVGVRPEIIPVRGGTDGTRLSFMGLPCPNLCAGGHNFHGRYEYVPVQSMEKISAILQEIVSGYARGK
ncbi:peptidase T [uncultured Akkermansia sp.]|uniref:peptidase T n=1 Tax=Akkermansia sp. TaxID=1872421 RepID=UPI0025E78683|nr:peptidase T [uncultured Akkermansia sp.]